MLSLKSHILRTWVQYSYNFLVNNPSSLSPPQTKNFQNVKNTAFIHAGSSTIRHRVLRRNKKLESYYRPHQVFNVFSTISNRCLSPQVREKTMAESLYLAILWNKTKYSVQNLKNNKTK